MDVLDLLNEMRSEQREDHNILARKVDEGFAAIAKTTSDHELLDTQRFATLDDRVKIIESTRRTIIWLGATAVGSVLAAAAEFFFVHFKS